MQFQKGNKASAGIPKPNAGVRRNPTAMTLQKALDEILTPQKWQQIVQKAIEQAAEGDHTARAWLADRAAGKAVQRTEVDATISNLTDAEIEHLLTQAPPEEETDGR